MGPVARGIAMGTAVVVLGGCGADPTVVATGDAMAALAIIDTSAEHRALTAEVFTTASDGQPLDAGDTIRTDATGFAEVQYADGSLTRLGAETVLTVVALDGDVTVPEIELDLDVGRVWNRVNTVTGERGRFEVVTDVGTAAVRGTAFAIECTPEPRCTFTVTEGIVVVTTPQGTEIEIRAGEVVTLGRDDDGSAAAADGAGGDGADGDGTSDGGGGGDGATDGAPRRGTTVLARAALDLASADGPAQWANRNDPLDAATGRFAPDQQRCSVTLAGRNLDHAQTPETAIEAPIDETLRIDAVATGPLERYVVDLELGGLALRAAEGEVLPDESGDRTTFRGDVDVSEYAEWGVGLYEVHARTTGTVCAASAFVRVTGRPPLTTGTGLLALLLVLGGALGLGSAFRLAGGGTLPTFTFFKTGG